MSITAMKQAMYLIDAWERGADSDDYASEIAALRQAIEQAEKQEPYCWVQSKLNQGLFYKEKPRRIHTIPLYTAPPMTPEHLPQYIATDGKPMESGGGGVCSHPRKKWVGLTDDDLRQIILVSIGVAEAKLKVKNT